MSKKQVLTYPLFNLGFRAFFFLAGFSALILLVLWNAIQNGQFTAGNYFGFSYWHAHEMLLGYSTAVIAGFLLTAVKNWTGVQTINGDRLAALCLLWLYGRIVPFYADLLPDGLIALVDFAFLPVLAFCISKPILASGNFKNLLFVGLLALMALGNGLIHMEMLGLWQETAWQGTLLVVAVIIMMILLIAGRIFPFFTERGLPGTFAIRNPLYDILSIASAGFVFVMQLFGVDGTALALAAFFAAIVNVLRVSGWYVQRVWYVPLLWVLYTGYAWIILGFVLTALSAYSLILPSLSIHAFTVGGIGVLTLGMMARVSLGHTGRALKASNTMAIAFVLINLATFLRVLLPIAVPAWYSGFIYLSTLSWFAAFSLFVFVYAPILTTPRVDGQQG